MNACNNEEVLTNTTLKDEKLEIRNNEDCFDFWELENNCLEIGFQINQTDVIVIDENCEITVYWDEYYCTEINPSGNYQFTLFIENFEYDIPEGECLSQIHLWENLESQGKTEELSDALDAFEYEASLLLEDERVSYYDSRFSVPDCDDMTPSLYVFVEYYSNVCFLYSPGPSAGQEPDFTNIIKSPCGWVCCKRNSQYCYNNGSLERTDLGYELSGANCGEEPIDPPIGGLSQAWGDCDHNCTPD